jgi:hypothetical protein
MKHDDVLAQLQAVNPVADADLSLVDPGALVALREGITMTGRQAPQANSYRRRIGRRGVSGAIVTVALLGGGAAYAGHQWYAGGASAEKLACGTQWADQTQEILDNTGGPPLTGNPVADCQRYQAQSGRPPIQDPVAFRRSNPEIYVLPRSQVPADSTVLPAATPRDEALSELQSSTDDLVDGLGSRCLSGEEARVFAHSELARLGLTDVKVVSGPTGNRPCARVWLDWSRLAVVVAANDQASLETLKAQDSVERVQPSGIDPSVPKLRDALRAGITDKCVGLAKAEAVATSALGEEDHWPLVVTEDPTASCSRVDMRVGGSVQITIRGPKAATR